MKKNTLKLALLIATLASAAAFAPIVSAAPPTPVAEMSKKEAKAFKRDAKAAAFDTKVFKDKAAGLTWIESPVESAPSTPNLRHYFRAAFKDGSVVALQIIVTQVHLGYTEFDASAMNFTSSHLDGIKLPTEIGEPMRGSAEDTVTQRSAITISEPILRSHATTGMHLFVTNTFGDTEVPIKASLIDGYLSRFDSLKAKESKKK